MTQWVLSDIPLAVPNIADLQRRAALHAALGDPHRLAVVDELLLSDRSPSDLCEALGMPSNLLAHHLDVLERAGLVERRVSAGDRRRRYLTLRRAALEAVAYTQVFVAREVVFVCTQNSARSQLAAAIWNASGLAVVEASSAGTQPAARVHHGAIEAALRHGLRIEGATPRRLERFDDGQLLVTVCDRAQEELPAERRPLGLHWSIDDPVLRDATSAFDEAFETIEARVRVLAPLVRVAA